MKSVIQRASSAKVIVDNETVAEFTGPGLVCLVGFGKEDTEDLAISRIKEFIRKISHLRVFANLEGKFDLSLRDINGTLLLIPQFTLYADTNKGRRPEFFKALEPDKAKQLFLEMIEIAKTELGKERVQSGIFGADMKLSLTNDGPVTIIE